MKWSGDEPNMPGWYWLYEHNSYCGIVSVTHDGTGNLLVVFAGDVDEHPLKAYPDCRWAGPIHVPEDPYPEGA